MQEQLNTTIINLHLFANENLDIDNQDFDFSKILKRINTCVSLNKSILNIVRFIAKESRFNSEVEMGKELEDLASFGSAINQRLMIEVENLERRENLAVNRNLN